MPKRLIITIVCFHITAALSLLAGVAVAVAGRLFAGLFPEMTEGLKGPEAAMFGQVFSAVGIGVILMALFVLCWVAWIEVVVWGLNKRNYWAWIMGLVICGLMIVSGTQTGIGLVLGGLSLWGLVDPDSVEAFRPAPSDTAEPPTDS